MRWRIKNCNETQIDKRTGILRYIRPRPSRFNCVNNRIGADAFASRLIRITEPSTLPAGYVYAAMNDFQRGYQAIKRSNETGLVERIKASPRKSIRSHLMPAPFSDKFTAFNLSHRSKLKYVKNCSHD